MGMDAEVQANQLHRVLHYEVLNVVVLRRPMDTCARFVPARYLLNNPQSYKKSGNDGEYKQTDQLNTLFHSNKKSEDKSFNNRIG